MAATASGVIDGLNDVVGPITMQQGTPGEFSKITVLLDYSVGTLVGTVQLQASFDGGSTWRKVKDYTADAYEVVDAIHLNMQFQLKCTAYTSGDGTGWLGYGEVNT